MYTICICILNAIVRLISISLIYKYTLYACQRLTYTLKIWFFLHSEIYSVPLFYWNLPFSFAFHFKVSISWHWQNFSQSVSREKKKEETNSRATNRALLSELASYSLFLLFRQPVSHRINISAPAVQLRILREMRIFWIRHFTNKIAFNF